MPHWINLSIYRRSSKVGGGIIFFQKEESLGHVSVEHFYISHTQGISFLPSYSLLKAAGPQPCVNNHTEGLRGALTALQEAGRKGRWGRRRLQELSDGGWRGSKTLTH